MIVFGINGYVGSIFLDGELREYLEYSFREDKPGQLFLTMLSYREYEDNSDQVRTGTTIISNANGKEFIRRYTRGEDGYTLEETTGDVSSNWEPYPEFGQYDSISRIDRWPTDSAVTGRMPLFADLKRCKDTGRMLVGTTPVPSATLDSIVMDHPSLPEDYIAYLREVGWGELGNSCYMVYSGPVGADEIYGEDLPADVSNLVFFGDDFAGYCAGFALDGDGTVVEIEPSTLELEPTGLSFGQFIRRRIAACEPVSLQQVESLPNALNEEQILKRIRAKYGMFFDGAAKETVDPRNVPRGLRPFIPYAQLWGISDDYDREQFVMTAPKIATEDLVAIVRSIDDELDEWLAGEEALSDSPSNEYVAFSAMRMAADFV